MGFEVWSRLLRAEGGLAAMQRRARAPAVLAAVLWFLAAAAAGDADAGGLERA